MESREIKDYQITESSECIPSDSHRLFHSPAFEIQFLGGTLLPGKSGNISINLLENHIITALATQGGVFRGSPAYATQYKLMYKGDQEDHNSWKTYLDLDGSEKVHTDVAILVRLFYFVPLNFCTCLCV